MIFLQVMVLWSSILFPYGPYHCSQRMPKRIQQILKQRRLVIIQVCIFTAHYYIYFYGLSIHAVWKIFFLKDLMLMLFGRPSRSFDPISPKAKNQPTNYEYEPYLYYSNSVNNYEILSLTLLSITQGVN